MATSEEALLRINGHEELCALRYQSIDSRIGRIETILWSVAGGIILQLCTLVYFFAPK